MSAQIRLSDADLTFTYWACSKMTVEIGGGIIGSFLAIFSDATALAVVWFLCYLVFLGVVVIGAWRFSVKHDDPLV
jgi:hypothetical protein